MRASALEFRLRVIIHAVLVILGFWSPWIEYWNLGRRISLLEWLALELSRLGVVSFAYATPIVIICATLMAALSVWLRIWGAAYLDPGIVHAAGMNAGKIMASGPYRYVRNPLYLGVIFMVAAMAFAMPVSGAVFVLILVPLFDLRLILGEEKFLSGKLHAPSTGCAQSLRNSRPSASFSPLPFSGGAMTRHFSAAPISSASVSRSSLALFSLPPRLRNNHQHRTKSKAGEAFASPASSCEPETTSSEAR